MTLTPDTLSGLIERHGISKVELARRSGLARPNLHHLLSCRHSPRLTTWGRVVAAYHELRAEQVGREEAARERRRMLLDSDPDLARALQLFAGAAVLAGECSERYAAEACGLSFEEWCALPGM
ncbi:hypothetical protein [Deinococcus sp. NW-56]|uniref:hypothetical protein n=1 Tax=Deinococcus sp. NW-56 TaxID=2080419 RepID=UPI000CF48C57|nr:hypothetical protein [Deinococcus sp. NW-56]